MGKPYLQEPKSDLQFNFSRSEDCCVCAVLPRESIGVDIEIFKPLVDMENTAATIFNAADLDAWKMLSDDLRRTAFFRCWTRKEAIAKANGEGLTLGVKRIAVEVSESPLQEMEHVLVQGRPYWLTDVDMRPDASISCAIQIEPTSNPPGTLPEIQLPDGGDELFTQTNTVLHRR